MRFFFSSWNFTLSLDERKFSSFSFHWILSQFFFIERQEKFYNFILKIVFLYNYFVNLFHSHLFFSTLLWIFFSLRVWYIFFLSFHCKNNEIYLVYWIIDLLLDKYSINILNHLSILCCHLDSSLIMLIPF